jgi:hypothetical protein
MQKCSNHMLRVRKPFPMGCKKYTSDRIFIKRHNFELQTLRKNVLPGKRTSGELPNVLSKLIPLLKMEHRSLMLSFLQRRADNKLVK